MNCFVSSYLHIAWNQYVTISPSVVWQWHHGTRSSH